MFPLAWRESSSFQILVIYNPNTLHSESHQRMSLCQNPNGREILRTEVELQCKKSVTKSFPWNATTLNLRHYLWSQHYWEGWHSYSVSHLKADRISHTIKSVCLRPNQSILLVVITTYCWQQRNEIEILVLITYISRNQGKNEDCNMTSLWRNKDIKNEFKAHLWGLCWLSIQSTGHKFIRNRTVSAVYGVSVTKNKSVEVPS